MNDENEFIALMSGIEKKGKFGTSQYWKLAIFQNTVLFYLPKFRENLNDNVGTFVRRQGLIGGFLTEINDATARMVADIEEYKSKAKKYIELSLNTFHNLPVKSKFFSKIIEVKDGDELYVFKFSNGLYKNLLELTKKP